MQAAPSGPSVGGSSSPRRPIYSSSTHAAGVRLQACTTFRDVEGGLFRLERAWPRLARLEGG
eukprot:5214113-Prymnesium_polylepis.1